MNVHVCLQTFSSTIEENWWILQKAADDLGGAPVRLVSLVLGSNQMFAQIVKTLDMPSDAWEDEYLEMWRTYGPTALSWGALQILLRSKKNEEGHLTPSMVGIIFQAEPSLFRNLVAGLTKRDKSDRTIESKHRLRHLVTSTDRLYRQWTNIIASLNKKKQKEKEQKESAEAADAHADVVSTSGQRKVCVQECQHGGLYRFEDRRDEFFRTKLWPRWVNENRKLWRNWSRVLHQIRQHDATDSSATAPDADVRNHTLHNV